MIDSKKIAEFEAMHVNADLIAGLEEYFFETKDYRNFRKRVFDVLALRESRLAGGRTELSGAALIGPAGAGKTMMIEKISAEHDALVEATGGRKFGSKILSIIVPGRATVRDTCKEILGALEYDIVGNRDENYFLKTVETQLELHKIAGLHLDEVQDSGRYTTSDSMRHFAVKFRNFMQKKTWPVCVIITGTLEAKTIINQDETLRRRLKPIEMMPMALKKEGIIMQAAIKQMLSTVGLTDDGLFNETEFLRILMHAAAGRFGMAIETAVEAIGAAKLIGDTTITIDHFAEAYFVRMNCDDECNPFISRLWKNVDTTKAMARYVSDTKERRKKLPRT